MYLILGLIVFIVVLFAASVPGGFIYLVYLPFKRKLIRKGKLSKERNRQINVAYFTAIILFASYLTLDAFFPGRDFYEDEFETVTMRKVPASANFINSTSSYPDPHGDYCSSSQIQLSKADYKQLLRELNKDKNIAANGELMYSYEFNKTLGNKNPKQIIYSFTRQIEGEEDHYLYIGFYDDERTIFVNVCVT